MYIYMYMMLWYLIFLYYSITIVNSVVSYIILYCIALFYIVSYLIYIYIYTYIYIYIRILQYPVMLYCRNLRGEFPYCLRWSLVSDTVQSRSSVICGVNNWRARLFLYLAWLRECHWYTTESFFLFWDEVPLVSGNSGFTHVYSIGNMGREKHVGQFVLQSQQFHLIRIHLSLDLFGDRQKILRISSILIKFWRKTSVPLGPLKKVPSPCCKKSRSGAVGDRNLGKLGASPQEIEKTLILLKQWQILGFYLNMGYCTNLYYGLLRYQMEVTMDLWVTRPQNPNWVPQLKKISRRNMALTENRAPQRFHLLKLFENCLFIICGMNHIMNRVFFGGMWHSPLTGDSWCHRISSRSFHPQNTTL